MKGHRYSAVTRSGRQMPQVAPASTAILQIVIRAAMPMLSTTGPTNSITLSVAPLTVSRLMMARMTSLAVTRAGACR